MNNIENRQCLSIFLRGAGSLCYYYEGVWNSLSQHLQRGILEGSKEHMGGLEHKTSSANITLDSAMRNTQWQILKAGDGNVAKQLHFRGISSGALMATLIACNLPLQWIIPRFDALVLLTKTRILRLLFKNTMPRLLNQTYWMIIILVWCVVAVMGYKKLPKLTICLLIPYVVVRILNRSICNKNDQTGKKNGWWTSLSLLPWFDSYVRFRLVPHLLRSCITDAMARECTGRLTIVTFSLWDIAVISKSEWKNAQELIDWVCASMTIPGVTSPPRRVGDKLLMDAFNLDQWWPRIIESDKHRYDRFEMQASPLEYTVPIIPNTRFTFLDALSRPSNSRKRYLFEAGQRSMNEYLNTTSIVTHLDIQGNTGKGENGKGQRTEFNDPTLSTSW